MKSKDTIKGIFFIILSGAFFALMNYFVRLSGDLPAMQKSFFRNLISFFAASAVMQKSRIWFFGGNGKYLLLRSVFGTVGVLCNFYAVDHLLLADASMLNKMSPFFSILFSIYVLKERVKPAQALILTFAFVGSLFIIKPSGLNMDFFPALIGFFGGICAGAAYTYVRKLSQLNEQKPCIVAFFSLFSCIVTAPFLIFDYHPMTFMQLASLLLAGAAAAGGQFSVTAAYACAPARDISVYSYSQILFSALIGFFAFGQIPDLYSWVGYGIIISMAVLMFWYSRTVGEGKDIT